MKKRTLSLLLALCLALTLTIPGLAADTAVDVGNDVTVNLPDGYLAFTPANPKQTLSDGSELDLSKQLEADGLQLIAMKENGEITISVSTAARPDSIGSALTEAQIDATRDAFVQEYVKNGYTVLSYEALQHKDTAFVKSMLRLRAKGQYIYTTLYYTLCDGSEFFASAQAASQELLEQYSAETDSIMTAVQFGPEETEPEETEPVETAAPAETTAPAETAAPVETAAPAETATPAETAAPVETTAPVVTPAPQKDTFTDVEQGAYYYDAVNWALEMGITTGTTSTTFSPANPCTRAQVVTFLWRANGSPKVSGTNPFTDVPADAYYYDAVLWAVEKGITTGTSATTFSPANPCTRAQVVTFLWRASDKPAPTGGNGFSDVPSGQYYYDAVLWAVEKEITNGTGNGLFSPDQTCTRGQIVTFLYRALK